MNKLFTTFSQQLRLIAESKGLSQADLAAKLEIPKQTVNGWFRGLSHPNLPMACRLADVLDVSLDFLTGRSDKE